MEYENIDRVASLDEAVNQADYYANIACRAILTTLEADGYLSQYNRKIILDAVNDFKRNIVRFIYGAS